MPRPLDRLQQAAIDRLNLHIGRMALADYEEARRQIEQADNEQLVREILYEWTEEEVRM